jgi:hypothetical protein
MQGFFYFLNFSDVKKELAKAVRYFWRTPKQQSVNQGSTSGRKDAGKPVA